MGSASHGSSLPARCWVEIDLSAIEGNVRRLVQLVGPRTMVIAVVKANGYGHGAVAAAEAALAGGATRLAVATFAEALPLRQAAATTPLHVLGPLLVEEIEAAVEADVITSPYDRDTLERLSRAARRLGKDARVHLKIDTGMGRHGCAAEESAGLATRIRELPGVRLEGVCTHLAQADAPLPTQRQLETFDTVCAQLRQLNLLPRLRHASNSNATVLYPEARYEAIRPGLAMYGLTDHPQVRHLGLEPALAWKTRVLQLKDFPAGHAIGYNRTFTTARPTRLAILGVGYADGYRRAFSNLAHVLIQGRRCPVVGMVSMDCATADVTDVPAVRVNDEVALVGSQGQERITVEELAGLVPGTIPYEIVTSVGGRTRWIYRNQARRSQAA